MRLTRSFVIILLALLLPGISKGQASLERTAQNNLEKGKWEKAKGKLLKSLRKDSLNATARYLMSSYYFAPGNPAFQIDSAYRNVMSALADFSLASPKVRDKMKRFPLDSAMLIRRREAIDSAGFVRAKGINTEQAYLDFIAGFPFAAQLERAKELRDEVAYVDALKENTYESFLDFLTKYPDALRADEARVKYEKLLFEAKTKDRKLESYSNFIEQYPESPYRPQAELQVFEISTASGKPESFSQFIKQYRSSKWVPRAKNILYHILKEKDLSIPTSVLTDSIKNLQQLERHFLVPFSKDDKFGFMSEEGKEIIRPSLKSLYPDYVCGNITDELLIADRNIIARNGSIVYSGEVQEIEDLGFGFILVETKNCSALIHKSGFIIEPCIEDAKICAGSYLAVKKKNRWSMKTFTGRELMLGEFEEINSFDEVVVLKQSGKYKMIAGKELAIAADQVTPDPGREYNEVKRWGNLIWVRVNDQQALLNMNFKEVVGLGKKEITPEFFGAVSKTTSGYKLWSSSAGESVTYDQIKIQKPWIAAKLSGRWQLLDKNFRGNESVSFDSLYFIGPFGIAVNRDSLRAYVSPDVFIQAPATTTFQFLPGKDSTYFLILDQKGDKSIFNSTGVKLFSINADKIEYAGENLLITTRKDKRNLVNLEGKSVMPAEYDAFGNIKDGMLPVLKNKKFGFLDVQKRKEIKAEYEKNLVVFNADYLIAFKNNLYGIIDWNNKPIVPFEYEEIRFWNDSTALVKRNFQWIIYNFVEKKIVVDKIKDFRWLRDTREEKLLIFHQENSYGVISNRLGIVLPATYSDIVNLGSAERPLYFTEKHVEEASIYVVIYYNEKGALLRRQVFEIDDYDKIYCTHN